MLKKFRYLVQLVEIYMNFVKVFSALNAACVCNFPDRYICIQGIFYIGG